MMSGVKNESTRVQDEEISITKRKRVNSNRERVHAEQKDLIAKSVDLVPIARAKVDRGKERNEPRQFFLFECPLSECVPRSLSKDSLNWKSCR